MLGADLGGEEYFGARDGGAEDGGAAAGFVAVGGGGVDLLTEERLVWWWKAGWNRTGGKTGMEEGYWERRNKKGTNMTISNIEGFFDDLVYFIGRTRNGVN